MARYRRMRRKFKSGTKYVKQVFQSFFDFSTDENMQILTIKAGGASVNKRLSPFFAAFKYVKMGKVSIKLVPASTLPIDPTGLSYEVGENTVDPRDQLTPGLARITNGEFMIGDITGLSKEKQHQIYNQMLLDNRWFKWMLQTGVKKIAKPLVWQIANVHQQSYPDQFENLPVIENVNGVLRVTGTGTNAEEISNPGSFDNAEILSKLENYSSKYGTYQIGKNAQMGWLPTDTLNIDNEGNLYPSETVLPEIELIKIVTPPAYKTKYYYRCYVTETYYFKEPVCNYPYANGAQGISYGMLDRFIFPITNKAMLPGDNATIRPNVNGNDGTGGKP